jgi:transketolase
MPIARKKVRKDMNALTEKKPRLTTSAMIASIASEGQRVQAAPFGKALVEYAATHPEVVGMTADLAKYTDLHLFAQAYPERFFQMGMAEQLLIIFLDFFSLNIIILLNLFLNAV